MAAVLTAAQSPPLLAFLRHFQPFSTPQAIDARVARSKSVTTKQSCYATVSESWMPTSKLKDFLHKQRLIIAGLALVSMAAARLADDSTSTSFRNAKLTLQLRHCDTLPRRAYQFPSSSGSSMRFSRLSSATILTLPPETSPCVALESRRWTHSRREAFDAEETLQGRADRSASSRS